MPQKPLPIRQLGQTQICPTALAMGGAWIGTRSDCDDEAIKAVVHAFEHGINFFDTSPSYNKGESERRLGLALRNLPRDSIYVSTKVGTRHGMRGDFSPAAIERSFAQSLDTLGVDYVDLLLIHDPSDIDEALDGAIEPMLRLKQQGVVRHIGLGCRPHAFHHRAMSTGEMDVVLTFLDYTLLNQSALPTMIAEAVHRGIGLLLASPLGMGTLTGVEPDARKHPRAHAMWRWCRDRGVSVRDLALQFCLALPIDGAVVAGPGTAKEVAEVIASATTTMDESIWTAFEREFGVQCCTRRDQIPTTSAPEEET